MVSANPRFGTDKPDAIAKNIGRAVYHPTFTAAITLCKLAKGFCREWGLQLVLPCTEKTPRSHDLQTVILRQLPLLWDQKRMVCVMISSAHIADHLAKRIPMYEMRSLANVLWHRSIV